MSHDVGSPLIDAVVAAVAGAPIERVEKSADEPWFAWLLAALVRQRSRQAWLLAVIEGHDLRGVGDSGEVPALPGHRFEFHGRGCCIECPDGEIVDVDFWDDNGLTIDPYFFAARLWSIPRPELVEERVRELLPSVELCVLALRQLRARGLLWHDASEHVFRLPAQLETLAPTAPDLAREDARSLWRHHLGDFESPSISNDARATRLAAYHSYLLTCLETEPTALSALVGRVPEKVLVAAVSSVLAAPISSRTGALVEELGLHDGLPFTAAVLELVGRLDASKHHPSAALAVAHFLFRRGIEVEAATRLLTSFAAVERVAGFKENPFLGAFALLALEHAPQHALVLLRRALRSSTPVVRTEAVAILVILGHPWCFEEIARALADASVTESAPTLRAALSLLTGALDEPADGNLGLTVAHLRPRVESVRDARGDLALPDQK